MARKRLSKSDEKIIKVIEDYFGKYYAMVAKFLLEHPDEYFEAEEIARMINLDMYFVYKALYAFLDSKMVVSYIPMDRIETDRHFFWKSNRDVMKKGLISVLKDYYGRLENIQKKFIENKGSYYMCTKTRSLVDINFIVDKVQYFPICYNTVLYDFDEEVQEIEKRKKIIESYITTLSKIKSRRGRNEKRKNS